MIEGQNQGPTGAITRLLLWCSNQTASQDHRVDPELLAAVDDWNELAECAAEHLAIPFLNQAMVQFGSAVPEQVRTSVETRFRIGAARNLRLAALLIRLDQHWFKPRGIRYAAVKGVVVAQRYYGSISGRACRDLDLLIDPQDFEATVSYLCRIGFRLCRPFELPTDQAAWPAHIAAACDLNRELTMRSPDDDLVDVHSSLDLTGNDLPTSGLLDRTETVELLGKAIPVLSTPDLFVFICYHHSRHNWTRLHWVADLGRMAASPHFDRPAVLAAARRAGMEKLVLACLEMPALLTRVVAGKELSGSDLALEMVGECLAYIRPGAEAPMLEHHRRIHEKAFRWKRWFAMTGEEWRQRQGIGRKLRAVLRSVTPSWEVYRSFPMPKRWRWLYVPLRIGSHLMAYTPLGDVFGRRRK